MDLPPSILPYLGPTSASASLNTDDPLTFLFPSPPAVDAVDDTTTATTTASAAAAAAAAAAVVNAKLASLQPASATARPQNQLLNVPPLQTSHHTPTTTSVPIDSTAFLESSPPAHAIYDPSLANPPAYPLSLMPPATAYNPKHPHFSVKMESNLSHVSSPVPQPTQSAPTRSPVSPMPQHHPQEQQQPQQLQQPQQQQSIQTSSSHMLMNTASSTPSSSHPQLHPPQFAQQEPPPPPPPPLAQHHQNQQQQPQIQPHQGYHTPSPMATTTSQFSSHPTMYPSHPQDAAVQSAHEVIPHHSSHQFTQPHAPHMQLSAPHHQYHHSNAHEMNQQYQSQNHAQNTPPHSRSASLTHSSSGAASKHGHQVRTHGRTLIAGVSGGRVMKRVVKRDRSLQVMKAVASNNAPDVSLTDEELLQIGAMHESESCLAQSRELYESLVKFKRMLSKHGYRLSALHLDTVPLEQAAKAFNDPIDFVLKKTTETDKKGQQEQDQQTQSQQQNQGYESQPSHNTLESSQHLQQAQQRHPPTQLGTQQDVHNQTLESASSQLQHPSRHVGQAHIAEQSQHQQHMSDQSAQPRAGEQSPVSAVGKRSGHEDELTSLQQQQLNITQHAVTDSVHGEADADVAVDDNGSREGVTFSGGKRRRSMCNSTSDNRPGVADFIVSDDMDRQLRTAGQGEVHVDDKATSNADLNEGNTQNGASGATKRSRKRARLTGAKGETCTTGGGNVDGGGGRGNASHHSDRLGCAVCSKMMSDMDTLVRHFRHAHQELKPFSCPRCKGLYSSEGTLWHHIRNVHTETPRKYKCDFCDASYDSFGAKTRHEHATHQTGTPKFRCTFKNCGRAFNFPAHLEAHAIQAHPGFRPFACEECPKRFPSANGLTRHAREVHLRPQAYSCSCNKSYSKRCHLKRHLLRVHGMSMERVQEEMDKQPHPGLLHMVPKAPPASTE